MRRIERRRFLCAAGALAAAPLARAQKRADIPTLGMLSFARQPTAEAMAKSPFAAKLKSLGWVIGENLNIEYAYADGQLERLPELADSLVRKNVDVIWVVSPPAAVAADAQLVDAFRAHLIKRDLAPATVRVNPARLLAAPSGTGPAVISPKRRASKPTLA